MAVFGKKKAHTVLAQTDNLSEHWGRLPAEDEVFKLVSFCGVSTIAVIAFVARHTTIRRLDLSTFRIGPKALKTLCNLHEGGLLGDARFVVGKLMMDDQRKASAIDYYEKLQAACQRNGWELSSRNTHCKLTLLYTDAGRFVVESSSNLNEAPNWEQFSFSRDDDLYAFYMDVIDQMHQGEPPLEPIEREEGLAWPETEQVLKWCKAPTLNIIQNRN